MRDLEDTKYVWDKENFKNWTPEQIKDIIEARE